MPNFQTKPSTGNPDLDETFNKASVNFKLDNIDYKFYVYLINGDGNLLGLSNEAIELLNIKDNILEMSASGVCIVRNDNDVIERSNYNTQLQQGENYFSRQPKQGSSSVLDEFFFRNDCRDYLLVYIQPNLADLLNGEGNLDKLKPVSTLLYTFSILENEDTTSPEDDSIKFKKLTLVDSDLETLREKNLFFSSAKFSESDDLHNSDDSDRSIYTGEILKNLIIEGLDVGGSGETTEQNGSVIQDSLFSKGSTKLFYSSPGEFNVLNDIDYVLKRHTSSTVPFDPCLLRKDRYSQQYTLISYKDYFKNAIFQNENGSGGGTLHTETIYLGTESIDSNNADTKKRTPNTPFNNITFNDFSMVNNFNFYNMSGLDTQSKLVTTAVHSYELDEKEFQIDLYNNNITTSMETFYNYFVKGDQEYPLFIEGDVISNNTFLNQYRKNNLNYKNTFSINDKEPDQRLGFGRNDILKNMLFLNNAIQLNCKGLTFRSAGKFFSFERKSGVKESKFDDKVFGTYFCVEVNHNFQRGTYTNDIIGVKTYMFNDPKVKEVK